MTQDALDDFFIRAQFIQVRCNAASARMTYVPLTTLDGDVAVPAKLKAEQETVRERLLKTGFTEEFVGEDKPPATHYHYGPSGGFYVEFLSPLTGGEYDRQGKRKATQEVSGISSQRLRYIEILLLAPWEIELREKPTDIRSNLPRKYELQTLPVF
jgi:Nucleotidyltransferase